MVKKLKTKIINKIDSGEVKMKPRWHFWVRSAGIKAGATITIMTAAVLIAWATYLVELLKPKELLEYGDLGQQIILTDFPYLAGLASVFLALIGGALYSRVGENYKKTARIIGLTIAVAVIAVAVGLIVVRRWRELEIGLWLI
ncbi:MAG: hypothetical protein WC686_03465 [Candidatus Shapirobacteria bacterium]|jgi:hypothetical protein